MLLSRYLGLAMAILCLALCFSLDSTHTSDQQRKAGFLSTRLKKLNAWVVQVLKNISRIKPRINPKRVSSKCYEDLLYMTDLVAANHTSYSPTPFWQKQMLDSYGKLPAGLTEGNIFWMGDFTQCTNVKVWKNTRDVNPSRKPDFKGKYCLPNINHYVEHITLEYVDPLPIVATYGLCVPSTCSAFDMEKLVNEFFYPLHGIIEEKHCLTDDAHSIDRFTFYALIIFGTLGSIVLMATIWDIVPIMVRFVARTSAKPVSSPYGTFKSVVLSFSAYTNTKKLLDTSNRNQAFSAINGLRAMSMMAVVAGHMVAMTLVMSNGRHNPVSISWFIPIWWAQPLFYATYTVDTFFCLTGFLVAHVVMDTAMKVGRFNVLAFYIHRLWRLTPTYLLLTVFAAGPFHLTFTGPLWISPVFFNTTTCRANLWKTPLYIDVYYDISKPVMCMPHAWYLNTEMALYVMSAVILYPIVKKHWTGPLIWILAVLTSLITVGTIAHKHNLQNIASLYISGIHFKEFFEEVYIKPWGRAQPFLVGMFFGFIYYYKGTNLKLSKRITTILWTLTAVGLLGCLFINYPYAINYYGHAPSHLHNVMYITFSTTVWAMCIGWIILASATGYGGVINKILSWKFFVPIGRLSFCAYVVHLEVLAHFGSSRKQALYSDVYLMFFCGVSTNIVILFIAWMLCLLIEAPALQLESILINAVKKNLAKELDAQNKANFITHKRIPTKDTNI